MLSVLHLSNLCLIQDNRYSPFCFLPEVFLELGFLFRSVTHSELLVLDASLIFFGRRMSNGSSILCWNSFYFSYYILHLPSCGQGIYVSFLLIFKPVSKRVGSSPLPVTDGETKAESEGVVTQDHPAISGSAY